MLNLVVPAEMLFIVNPNTGHVRYSNDPNAANAYNIFGILQRIFVTANICERSYVRSFNIEGCVLHFVSF